jgi:hypothetical protein
MICQQWAAVVSSVSRSFPVTVSNVFRHGAVYFRATCISVLRLREIWICQKMSAKIFDVNFVMK